MHRYIVVFATIVFLTTLAMGCSGSAPSPSVSEPLDLGEKYLLELNYEQALVQFLKVISIEPMNSRGYTGAAEAYTALGQSDEAMTMLQRGYDFTGDVSILAVINNIAHTITPPMPAIVTPISTPQVTPKKNEIPPSFIPLDYDDFTLVGLRLATSSIEEAKVVLKDDTVSRSKADGSQDAISFEYSMSASQREGASGLTDIFVSESGFPGPWGIEVGDSMPDVISAMGLDPVEIKEVLGEEFSYHFYEFEYDSIEYHICVGIETNREIYVVYENVTFYVDFTDRTHAFEDDRVKCMQLFDPQYRTHY